MPRPHRNYSWIFPKPYLVKGHRGDLWCLAKGSSAAKTVYRHLEPRTPHGSYLAVSPVRLNHLSDLRHGTEFCMRMPSGVSYRFYVEKRVDMVYTVELPMEGEPGFDEWYGT